MSETMKAAIFVEPGKMTVEEVPKAALQRDIMGAQGRYVKSLNIYEQEWG